MSADDDEFIVDAYIVPPDNGIHPAHYYEKLVTLEEHTHLLDGEAVVDFLLSASPVHHQGRQVLGAVHLPSVQGKLKGVFTWMLLRTVGRIPDFLMILDKDYWENESDLSREILIYHEMCHCCHMKDRWGEERFNEDGRPIFGLVGHDVEEFALTVRRYGSYSAEIKDFIAAAKEGDTANERIR